ncbi:DUF222 domain-containing protein [Actinomycetes bacterium KLBMP 9797]
MLETLTQLGGLATGVVDAPVWPLSDNDLVTSLDEVHRLEQQLAATRLHLIREIDGRSFLNSEHLTSTAAWLRHRYHVSAQTGTRWVTLAKDLDQHPGLDAALSKGAVNSEQAQVIAQQLRQLPDDLDPNLADLAEQIMIGWADEAGFDPKTLREMAPTILHRIAPDIADRVDEEALRREEKRAEQTKAFNLSNNGDGRYRISGWLPAEAAAIVNNALDPLCKPLPEDDRTATQRRADALTDVCQRAMDAGDLPEQGGEHAHVAIVVDWDLLRQQVGIGQLDTGERLSPEQVRRWACDARLIPFVLGGQSQVLDAGRSRRLFDGPLRRAIIIRDRGCAFPSCDRPAKWCDCHHIIHWTDGGSTSLDNGVLLCRFHHRLIHQEDWQVRIAADGLPEFIPPQWVDPERRPRRNIYHRRE